MDHKQKSASHDEKPGAGRKLDGLSLSPLTFGEAVDALLKVKPGDLEREKRDRRGRKGAQGQQD